jgi:hypothetical protein
LHFEVEDFESQRRSIWHWQCVEARVRDVDDFIAALTNEAVVDFGAFGCGVLGPVGRWMVCRGRRFSILSGATNGGD